MSENFTDYVKAEPEGSMDDNSEVERTRLARLRRSVLVTMDELIGRHRSVGLGPEADELAEARQVIAKIEARLGR